MLPPVGRDSDFERKDLTEREEVLELRIETQILKRQIQLTKEDRKLNRSFKLASFLYYVGMTLGIIVLILIVASSLCLIPGNDIWTGLPIECG